VIGQGEDNGGSVLRDAADPARNWKLRGGSGPRGDHKVAPYFIRTVALLGEPPIAQPPSNSVEETKMKVWPSLLLLAALAVGSSAASTGSAQPAPAQKKAATPEDIAEDAGAPLIGKYAPAITLTTVDGKKIDLAKLYGKKPVYLKFWATWCVPCRLQMPHFENVERTLGSDVQVIALDAGFNETKQAVLDYRKTMGLTMPIVIDDGRLADALNLRITPQHIVIGRDGKILHVGHLADAKLDSALKQAIAEPSTASSSADAQRISATGHFLAPTLKTPTGETVKVNDGAHPSVIFFFSPWCETYLKPSRPAMADACLKEVEKVRQISSATGARWLGVAAGLWAGQNDLTAYQRDHSLRMPLALDETGAFFRAYKITDVPTFLVVDGKGRVIGRTKQADEANKIAVQAQSGKSPAKES
jgi:thiol-disulfide isomerase/thioredoxin